jgi:RND family efflux transporter MFP subunit
MRAYSARGFVGAASPRRDPLFTMTGRCNNAGLAALLPLAFALCACSKGDAAPPPQKDDSAVVVSVATATPAAGESRLDVAGTVRLKRETPLAFNTAGRIAAITVREGDRVNRGQLLARLDPTSLAAASTSARAEAARADADYRRLQGLFEKGWVTAPRVESARAAAAAARARVAQSGFDVGLASVRAPSAGVILTRPAEPGQMAMPGQTVLVLGELNSGYVLRVPLADADLATVRRGQAASVTIPALGNAPIAAVISEVGARGDAATGTFRVELSLPVQPGLRSGQIGTARLTLARGGTPESAAGSVAIPATAVFSARADEGFVYVLEPAGGRVRLRQVALGGVDDRGVTITAGIRTGERVVTSGVDRLHDGARVTVARG